MLITTRPPLLQRDFMSKDCMGRLILFPKDPRQLFYTDFCFFMKNLSSGLHSYTVQCPRRQTAESNPLWQIVTHLQTVYFWKGLGLTSTGTYVWLWPPGTWKAWGSRSLMQSWLLAALNFLGTSLYTDYLIPVLWVCPALLMGSLWAGYSPWL